VSVSDTYMIFVSLGAVVNEKCVGHSQKNGPSCQTIIILKLIIDRAFNVHFRQNRY